MYSDIISLCAIAGAHLVPYAFIIYPYIKQFVIENRYNAIKKSVKSKVVSNGWIIQIITSG